MGMVPFRAFEVQTAGDALRTAAASWRPGRNHTREESAQSLYAHMAGILEHYPLARDVDTGHFTADIMLAEEAALLVHKDLDTRADLESAVEKTEYFKHWNGIFILVLTGHLRKARLRDLDNVVNRINNDFEFTSTRSVVVINKAQKQTPDRRR